MNIDTLNPCCFYQNSEIHSSSHYLFNSSLYLNKRTAFPNNIPRFFHNIFDQSDSQILVSRFFRWWSKYRHFKLKDGLQFSPSDSRNDWLSTTGVRRNTRWITFFLFSYYFFTFIICYFLQFTPPLIPNFWWEFTCMIYIHIYIYIYIYIHIEHIYNIIHIYIYMLCIRCIYIHIYIII